MPNRMGAGACLAAVLFAASLTSCGGGGTSTPRTAGSAPGQTPSVQIRIVVPRTETSSLVRRPKFVSPGIASVSIAVNTNSQPTIANISATSPSCTSTSTGITCIVAMTALAGTDTFTITAYDQPNAQGNVLSIGTAVVTIVPGTNTVNVTLNGVVTSISLTLTVALLATGTPTTTTLVLQAMDAQGNTIVGPGNYSDANGNPLAITVTDSDTSGATTINGAKSAKVTSPSNATLTVQSNGSAPNGTTVTFSATATGITTASALLGLATPGSTLYVLDGDNDQINAYMATSNGNVAPLRTILPTLAQPGELAYDSAGNIYITDDNGNTNGVYEERVQVYAPNASGNAAPIRSIAGPATGLNGVYGIAVDANGYVWVANYQSGSILSRPRFGGSNTLSRLRADRTLRRAQNARRTPQTINPPFIAAFSPGANGNVAPVGLIQGSTALSISPNESLAFDPQGNLWLSGGTVLRAFSAAQLATVLSNGLGSPYNTAPAITISGFAGTTYAVTFDAAGTMYANNGTASVAVIAAASIPTPGPSPTVIPLPSPTRFLTGTRISGIAVDNSGTVYVGGYASASPYPAIINVYENDSTTPTRSIAEPLPDLETCYDTNLGVSAGRIDILDSYCAYALYSYPMSASGQATPSRIIQSPLIYPCGLWEDRAGYLYSANCSGATGGIAVFSAAASGYAQPMRVIVEDGTLDSSYYPNTVGVDAAGNVYGLNCPSTTYNRPAVAVFSPTQNGLVMPIKALNGTATTLSSCLSRKPGFDPSGNLVIANGSTIDFFAPGPLGNIAPIQTITNASLTSYGIAALFVDAAGNVYVAQGSTGTTQILVFAAGQYGNVSPMRTIVASPSIASPNDMWVDGSGAIYVAEAHTGVVIFPPGSTGNYNVISGNITQIDGAWGVAVGL